MSEDPVREFLLGSGASDRVVAEGLKGLTEGWESFARSVANGYPLDIDSYLNDLDIRQLLAEALAVAPDKEREEYLERISGADRLLKRSVKPVGRCLWGDEVAQKQGWTAERNWWYFSRPITAGRELLDHLDNR